MLANLLQDRKVVLRLVGSVDGGVARIPRLVLGLAVGAAGRNARRGNTHTTSMMGER